MRLEILGSGGATTAPRPGCACGACSAARVPGSRSARTGPSAFLHGAGVLFDTPEEVRLQLERAGIDRVVACFYSHWHPDHTAGRRIFETINRPAVPWPFEGERVVTDVYLPAQVAVDFRERGIMPDFEFYEERGYARLHELQDGDVVTLDGVEVRPFRVAEDYVYAFELRHEGRRALLAPDELYGWRAPPELCALDVAVVPAGLFDVHPLSGERLIAERHPILGREATFLQTLALVAELAAGRTVLTHVEEAFGVSHEDLLEVEAGLEGDVSFAWDGRMVEL